MPLPEGIKSKMLDGIEVVVYHYGPSDGDELTLDLANAFGVGIEAGEIRLEFDYGGGAALYMPVAYITETGDWVKPNKRWCVFDTERPDELQSIVEAPTAEAAVDKFAADFGWDVEEAQ